MKNIVIVMALAFLGQDLAWTQELRELATPVNDSLYRTVTWGDIDKDGDLDMLITGSAWGGKARVYRNANGNLTTLAQTLDASGQGASWGDFDKDGFADLALVNSDSVRLYRNQGGTLVRIGVFPGVPNPIEGKGAADWGDYDKDGDLDLLVAGGGTVRIYNNAAGVFAPVAVPPVQSGISAARWGHFDQDGRLDILLSGFRVNQAFLNTPSGIISAPAIPVFGRYSSWADMDGDGDFDLACLGTPNRIYRNDAGVFTDIGAAVGGIFLDGWSDWGDFDGDGDLDFLIMGDSSYDQPSAKIYRNDAGIFTDIHAPLTGMLMGDAVAADIDGDGRPDVSLIGRINFEGATVVFRNIGGGFKKVATALNGGFGKSIWGDYDADGDPDLLLVGWGSGAPGQYNPTINLYRNDAGTFVDAKAGLPGLDGTAVWGDIDRDGDLDLLLAGADKSYVQTVSIFRNNRGAFEKVDAVLPQFSRVDGAFGDYDNDGDLDLILSGDSAYVPQIRLFRNDSGSFEKTNGVLRQSGRLPRWGDFDNDGDPDLLLCSTESLYGNGVIVVRNEKAAFPAPAIEIPGYSCRSAEWGDYDSDGDLDILMTGASTSRPFGPVTKIFRNFGGNFLDLGGSLQTSYRGTAVWGDYDNDGDLDVLVAALTADGVSTNCYGIPHVYRNDNGAFSDIGVQSDSTLLMHASWADYDGDGDLDFIVNGRDERTASYNLTQLFRNGIDAKNQAPAPPIGLDSRIRKDTAFLSWSRPKDDATPSGGLKYQVRLLGPGVGEERVALASIPASGTRLLPEQGPIQEASWFITGLPKGKFQWSVQAVDAGYSGSIFPPAAAFQIGTPVPNLVSAEPGKTSVRVTWDRIEGSNFQRYFVYGDTLPNPGRVLDSTGTFNDTVKTLTGLLPDRRYFFRVTSQDRGYNESGPSNELAARTDSTPPPAPSHPALAAEDRAAGLRWDPVDAPDLSRYLVWQKTSGGAWIKIDSTLETRIVIRNLSNGVNVSFTVSAVDSVGNESPASEMVSGAPHHLVEASLASLDFGRIAQGTFKDSVLYFENRAAIGVAIDSISLRPAAFSLKSALRELGANSLVPLFIRFAPQDADGGRFTGVLRIHFGGTYIEVPLAGTAAGQPFCRITGINPGSAPWDSSLSVQFLAVAGDSDKAGEGEPIRQFLWSSSRLGKLAQNGAGFSMKASELGIGVHEISLRVVDNEGDTSLPAIATLAITGRKALVKIDGITPPNLILKGGEDVRFHLTAFDRDEFADPVQDSLRSLSLYSTLQGVISHSKDTAFSSGFFALGLHGFYAKAVDNEGDTAVSDTIWVPVQPGIGHALVAAGTAFADYNYFFMNIAANANLTFGRLLQRGFSREQIHYLNPVGWQSLANPYVNSLIVDETEVTLESLKRRLLKVKPDVENGVPLLIALIGHGQATQQQGRFYLNPDQALLPDTLDAWLNEIHPDATTPIVVLLDFCYAGSFFKGLLSGRQNRILIGASAADRQAYFVGGRGFSFPFFNAVQKGKSVTDAFLIAKEWSDANAPSQSLKADPWVSGNADLRTNEEADYGPLRQVYIGGTQQFQAVGADWEALEMEQASSERLDIKARAHGSVAPDSAWYALLAANGDLPSDSLPWRGGRMTLNAEGRFEAQAELPPGQKGEVLVTVFGQVGNEAMAPLSATKVLSTAGLAGVAGLKGLALGRNAPNPFVEFTRVPFRLPKGGHVELTVYDLKGRLVRTLARGYREVGGHAATWDGKDESGMIVGGGLYWVQLKTPQGIRRQILIKK